MTEERRQQPRVPIRLQADLQFSSWDVFRLIYTINISQGGLNLELPQQLASGTRIRVVIHMPDGQEIPIEAEVRHSTSMLRAPADGAQLGAKAPAPRFSTGVQFVGLDDAKRQQIERLIASHTQGPGPSITRR